MITTGSPDDLKASVSEGVADQPWKMPLLPILRNMTASIRFKIEVKLRQTGKVCLRKWGV